MVYHFVILSDEVENFRREIDIDAEATFLDLHNAIIKSCNYKNDEMTSFFTCESDWTKIQEITMVDMFYPNTSGIASNEDPTRESGPIMERCHLDDYLQNEKDKLLYCFDMMCERYLFIQLQTITEKAHKLQAEVVLSKGDAPKQIGDIDSMFKDFEDDMYGDEDYDPDELDLEGFQDLDEMEGGGF